MRPERAPGSDDWQRAQSFDDLLALGRRFVRGDLDSFPGWGSDATDDESDDLEPLLVGLNGAGLLTVASQPGRPFSPSHDGRHQGGRAFVGGFATEAGAVRWAARADELGLIVRSEGPKDDAAPFQLPVGLRDGTPYLVLASGARADELEIFEGSIGRSAYGALRDCRLVWIVDPVWGRRSRLTRLLDRSSGV